MNQDARVRTITLNRPHKRNALNPEMCRRLVDAFDEADAEMSVGAIVLAANGPAFCSGMDLSEPAEVDIHERLFTVIHRIRTPVIAAVHGAALAGGMGLVANAHLVVAKPDAHFALTEIRLGLWPALIFRAVEAAIGERRAVELSLTGRGFSASDGLAYGLVTELADHPLLRAQELAARVADFSPVALAHGLAYVHRTRGKDWEDAGLVAGEVRDLLAASADFQEGARAFLEKRLPAWPSLTPGDRRST